VTPIANDRDWGPLSLLLHADLRPATSPGCSLPEGLRQKSPGRRPGWWACTEDGALKGRNSLPSERAVAPLQGFALVRITHPGVLPRAFLLRPFGAQANTLLGRPASRRAVTHDRRSRSPNLTRWILRILVCLILGAISTVAVAWGLAFRPEPNVYSIFSDGRFVRRLSVDRDILDTHINVDWGEFSLRQSWHWPGTDLTRWVDEGEYKGVLPRWSRCAEEEPLIALGSKRPPETTYHEFASGWPFLAARCSYLSQWNVSPDPVVSWGLLLIPQRFRYGENPDSTRRILPLVPIWPGFLINTIFYAAIWFALFFGLTSSKRFIRVRRGRCPRCGYDLRGQVERVRGEPPRTSADPAGLRTQDSSLRTSHGCPECGWGRADIDAARAGMSRPRTG